MRKRKYAPPQFAMFRLRLENGVIAASPIDSQSPYADSKENKGNLDWSEENGDGLWGDARKNEIWSDWDWD